MKSFRHVVGTKQASRHAQLFGSQLNFFRTALRPLARYCVVAILLGLPIVASATEFYVSPTGSASGTGSQASPWDLQTALNQPSAVKPGDTIWLLGGTYKGFFIANLNGTSAAPIIVRAKPGQRVIIDGNGGSNSIYKNTVTLQGNYTWIWGLEIINSWPVRSTSQTGSWPTDYPNGTGISTANSGTGNKMINLLVHDTPAGMGVWNGATETEVYGCLSFYNGWMGGDRPHGHGLYAQNELPGHKYIRDGLFFDNADHGTQVYGTTTVDGFTVEGNAYWNNSDLFNVTSGRNLLIGAYGHSASEEIMVSNMVYRSPGKFGDRTSDFYLGYGSGTVNCRIQDNYIVSSSQWGAPYTGLAMTGNLLYGPVTLSPASLFPNNTYTTTRPTGLKVFVRPNKYELGRANIVIYNWDLQNTVSVDISKVGLNVGDQYELHNAMNYFGDVITGTYSGGAISIPMTGRTIGAPHLLSAPPSPFPEFGVFVIMKQGGAATGNTGPSISTLASQTINADGTAGPLAFTVSDAQTAAGSLTLSGSSSNTSLVPNSGVVFGGSGASRTVTVTPAANQSGTATITVTVSDGTASASTSFGLTVNALPVANTAPTISTLASQTINANASAGPLAFTIGDGQTAAGSLTLSGSSSNTSLVPNSGLVFGGSGASHTVTVTPAANQSGTATITVTVSDGTVSASTSFGLTVNALPVANSAPTISTLASQTINANASAGPLAFTIGDGQTVAGSLTLTGSSSSSGLVPNGAIVFGGSGANRTVTVTPAANQFGSATITVTVSDGTTSASTSFGLAVRAPATVNTPPTISSIANRVIDVNTTTGPVPFTIGDAETVASSLTLAASSSNPSLIPSGGVVFSGYSTSRTVTVTPSTGQSGSATITLNVSDGVLSASTSFTVTVNPAQAGNMPPTISSIADQTVNVNTTVGPLAFTVGDAETPVGNLTVAASCSNPTLVPNGSIVLGGSGANRTITVTPAAGQSGTASILITVSDGASMTATSFALMVIPPNQSNQLVYLSLEAEAGTIAAPMKVTADPQASLGAYVSSSTKKQGTVSFTVDITVADTYVVWCRILAPDANTDSFFVSIDGGAEDIYDAAEGTWSPNWQWTAVNGRAGGALPLALNPRTFVLAAGTHTFVFRGRDAGTILDRVIITNDRDISFGEFAP